MWWSTSGHAYVLNEDVSIQLFCYLVIFGVFSEGFNLKHSLPKGFDYFK